MKTFLLALGGWLLLNILYVVIVMPPRRNNPSSPLNRVINSLRRLVRGRRHPPS
ncbi:hypothetical protein [Bradyrhizobium sp. SBR1B]|uniref:hypothetical protein n=1 Tax=Bradyrhizobium sp. SBR1B TaxID=2663836 RepID=UPI0016066DDF|nr:hypothetical protein [Bradyrhizobium sp. SBR1B]MBB4383639.1 type II secretory pathway component PulM [Bradyrhizobium sp. SBR1B]